VTNRAAIRQSARQVRPGTASTSSVAMTRTIAHAR
jgi:hypothetical protein